MRAGTAAVLVTALVLAGCAPSGVDAETGSDSGGPLSIEQALASEPAGSVAVAGYVVAAEGEPVRLCTALAESYPPQCGGPSLVVEGLELAEVEGLVRPDDPALAPTAWTERQVSLVGALEDETLLVSETSLG